MNRPLELADWIRRADERGLIASIYDIAGGGDPQSVVPLEWSQYCILDEDSAESSVLLENNPYPPAVFFGMFRVVLSDIGPLETRCLIRGCDREFPCVKVLYEGPRARPFPAGIRSTRDDRQAESGSGDGYTRYISWPCLEAAGMPPVYWRRPPDMTEDEIT